MRDDLRPIYLDHHATTPLDERVRDAMLPWLGARFGNPSSRSHVYGREASEVVEHARTQVAKLIGAKPREIVFTSGATEANHLALAGALRGMKATARHVVTSTIEHPAVHSTLEDLAGEGVETTHVRVDRTGLVDVAALGEVLRDDTKLVSVMLASSEIGTVQPIAAIATLASSRGIVVHCDAAQGIGLCPIDVSTIPLDLLSLSSHKIYGPMGTGALFVRDRHDLLIAPTMRGGGQERGLRGGTLNVPGIVGFGRACELLREHGVEDAKRLATLRDGLRDALLERMPGVHLHGNWTSRHPGNLSLRFDGVRADRLIMESSRELSFSSGSACASGSDAPSHVLRAIGLTDDEARSGIRLGLGRFTTEDDVTTTIDVLERAVAHIRAVTQKA